MNKEQEQEFFNQIEEVLQAHEGTYESGAWEEFDAHRKKVKRKVPIYAWAAAAIVLLIASFILFDANNTSQIQKNPAVVKNEQPDVNVPSDILAKPNVIETVLDPKVATLIKKPMVSLKVVDTISSSPINNVSSVLTVENGNPLVKNNGVTNQPLVSEKAIVRNTVKPMRENAGAYDSLMNRNNAISVFEKQASRFTYSLAVSPSLGNKKINFGAGMELSYAISNRLSISSGLIYAALNAQSDGKSLATASSLNGNQSANLSLTGLELPLGIQYQTKSGYYAAAGVSALGLINDKLEYNYLQETVFSMPQSSPGGAAELKVVSERKVEEVVAPLNNYMGFFNFSVGKKQSFGKTNLNIGPFVKIPFNNVSSERIRLLQGGIKLGIDF